LSTKEVENLVERHQRLVNAVARRSFPALFDDADLLQCGFIGLWRAAESWDGTRPFPPLASACIRNAMRNHLRERRRQHWGETVAPEEMPETPVSGGQEERLEELALSERIRKAFPPRSRERYVLLALARGESKKDIAGALGVDADRVQKIARRSYGKLSAAGAAGQGRRSPARRHAAHRP